MSSQFQPAIGQERILSLDLMRGIAILGIFLVNMISFHSPFLYVDPYEWWSTTADKSTFILIDIFIQASFYPLFSLLFGYGFFQLMERTQQKGLSFFPFAARRLTILLFIGIVHAFLIWHGDILITYAICGFLLLFFVRLSGKALLIIGTVTYVIFNLLFGLLILAVVLLTPTGELSLYNYDAAEASTMTYQQGTFMEITEQRFEDWKYVNTSINLVFVILSILPLFLIGAGAAKYKIFEQTEAFKRLILRLFFVSFLSGLLLKTLPYLIGNNPATTYFQDIFGGPLLAISIATGVSILSEKNYLKTLIKPLSSVGRMSISNYLFQSVLSTMIFYSYGLGLYGKVSLFLGTFLAVLIFVIQALFSSWWINRYYYGPVEWFWRSLTYMKIQRLKRREIN